MKNYLVFESTLPDDGKWTDKEIVLEPPGLEHAKLFVSHLPSSINLLDGPWNEEDYGWEFLAKNDGISVSVLIQPDGEDRWLAMVIPVSLFAFLRRRKTWSAVD